MGETGPGKALVLSGGREKDGFGFFADTRGEEGRSWCWVFSVCRWVG